MTATGSGIDLTFSAGPATIDLAVGSGTQTQGQLGYPILAATTPVVKSSAGTLVLDAANTLAASLTIDGGTVLVADPRGLGQATVSIAAGATLSVSPGLGPLNAVQVEAFGSILGTVDLGSGRITLTSLDRSQESVESLLEAGRNGGGWDGDRGIVSSLIASEAGPGSDRSIGWVTNPDGSVTIAYAAPGDANLDGEVNVFDLVEVTGAGAYGEGSPSEWSRGDFNADGLTNVFDLVLVSGAGVYGSGNYLPRPPSSTSLHAVPEPGLALPLFIGLAFGGAFPAAAMRYGLRNALLPPRSQRLRSGRVRGRLRAGLRACPLGG